MGGATVEELLLLYDFIAFAIGIFAIGCIYSIMRFNKNEIIRYYMIYYGLFTAFIGVFLLGEYLSLTTDMNQLLYHAFYSLQFLSLFLSLLTFAYLVNKVYEVKHSKLRNQVLTFSAIAWWLLCSVKEFGDDSNRIPWKFVEDDWFIVAIFIYIVITYIRYNKKNNSKCWYTDIRKIFTIILLSTPGLVFDGLFTGNGNLLYYTPVFFGFTSIFGLHFLYKYNFVVQEAEYEVKSDFRTQYSITERENEVIILLLKGYGYNKIAETLCISISTVRTHVMNIYKKVGINSRYELYNKVY
jgi:DNA-binding CsgD family transcriptional regulator